jgi:hypothetical protein
MDNALPIILIVAASAILTTKALDFGTSVANEGMTALNDKYRYRCVSLGDEKRGTILAVKAKTVRLSVLNSRGVEQIVEIERQPLDRFIVPCSK